MSIVKRIGYILAALLILSVVVCGVLAVAAIGVILGIAALGLFSIILLSYLVQEYFERYKSRKLYKRPK